MSYTITLWCGCRIHVSGHPRTNTSHARSVEQRGAQCRERRHQTGVRLWLWEMLPDPRNPEPRVDFYRPDL